MQKDKIIAMKNFEVDDTVMVTNGSSWGVVQEITNNGDTLVIDFYAGTKYSAVLEYPAHMFIVTDETPEQIGARLDEERRRHKEQRRERHREQRRLAAEKRRLDKEFKADVS